MIRSALDASLKKAKAFPAAGANNSSDSIDLGNTDGYMSPDAVDLEISWPDLAALADAKNVTFKVQHSADDVSFTDLGLQHIISGAGGAGVAAGKKTFRLPPLTKRYIRVNQAQDAAGGDITASSSTVQLRF